MAPWQELCSGPAFRSVAAMYTASRLRHDLARTLMKSAGWRGSDRWHAVEAAPVRTGCPFRPVSASMPSPHIAPHHFGAAEGSGSDLLPSRPGMARQLPPWAMSAQTVRALRAASATATTFTGLRASIRSSQSGARSAGTIRRPRRAFAMGLEPMATTWLTVGWSMRETLHASIALEALDMAIRRQRPAAGLIQHSDRGIQYAADEYRQAPPPRK